MGPDEMLRRQDDNTPWYATLATRWGYPAAVSLGLIYFLTRVVINDLVTIRTMLDEHSAKMELISQSLHTSQAVIVDTLRSIHDVNSSMTLVLTQICVNGAKTEMDRRSCFSRVQK